MKKDASRTLNNYLRSRTNTVYYLGDDSGIRMFSDFLKNGITIDGDEPDMVILKDSTAIVVEHFEFDSSYTNRKGSSYRKDEARIKREIQEKTKDFDEFVHLDTINASFTYENFITNVTENFLDHYSKIEKYKRNLFDKNIIKEDYDVKIMFLIEDVSPIGSMAFDINKNKVEELPVVLALSPEFLDLLANHRDVDFVMCCSCVGNNEYVCFIDRDDISSYKECQCDYANMKFFGNQPVVFAGCFIDSDN